MALHKMRNVISILMDSPLYLTLTLKERYSLLARMVYDYPFLIEIKKGEKESAYESAWTGGDSLPKTVLQEG